MKHTVHTTRQRIKAMAECDTELSYRITCLCAEVVLCIVAEPQSCITGTARIIGLGASRWHSMASSCKVMLLCKGSGDNRICAGIERIRKSLQSLNPAQAPFSPFQKREKGIEVAPAVSRTSRV